MKTFIVVRFDFDATHCWPEAIEQVSFLKNEHRHLFIVSAKIEVYHKDRELEFFLVKNKLKNYVDSWGKCLGKMSCETMAKNIATYINTIYGNRQMSIEVSEDGENSAIIEIG